jgi:thioredoxin 1
MKRLADLMRLVVLMVTLAAVIQVPLAQRKKSPDPPEPLVTFIELGSVRCIPCRIMQPVMRSIEESYGDQVKIVFHDVWTEQGQPYATQYGIRLIPTQVFLDKNGKEFFRHEGFYPKAEIEKLLQERGLKPRKRG